jgi:hypothetical protein
VPAAEASLPYVHSALVDNRLDSPNRQTIVTLIPLGLELSPNLGDERGQAAAA